MIDDFVFMCVLVGNDFLPNIPHLDISDGALNHMMNMYKVSCCVGEMSIPPV